MSKNIVLFTLIFTLVCIQLGCNSREKKSTESAEVASLDSSRKMNKPKNIKLLGQLSKGQSISFFYADMFDDTHHFNIDGKKDTVFDIYSSHPLLLFRANSTLTPYLIYPGDTILITHVRPDNTIQLRVKNNPERSNELNFFRRGENKMGKKYSFNIYETLIRSNSHVLPASHSPDFELLIDDAISKYNRQVAFLKDYSKKYDLSPYFNWFCKKYFYYDMILNELLPFIPEKYRSYPYSQSFLDTLNAHKSDFNCDSCLSVLPYRIAVNYYLRFLSRKELGGDHIFSMMWRNIKHHFSNGTRNYLLFHLVQTKLQKDPGYYKLVKDDFIKACTNNEYKDYIDHNYNIFVSRKKNIKDVVLSDPEGKELTWESILKRNRGKLIYLDFWASWCLPCRKEMPYSLELKSDYTNKDIAFIYISLDEKRTNWQNAVNELGLPTKNNYLLLRGKNSKLLNHLRIETIPKYILINNQGEIIDLDAPRPSSNALIQTINKYL